MEELPLQIKAATAVKVFRTALAVLVAVVAEQVKLGVMQASESVVMEAMA
jgi:hypothetical protein